MTKACVLQRSIWLNSISFVWRGVGYFAPGVFVSSQSSAHALPDTGFWSRCRVERGRWTWEDTKTPDANPPNKRFVLIFGYILEITLWKYVSITYFRDSIWLKYDQNTLMRLISKPWISLKSIRILDKTPEHMGQVINWPLPKAEIWKCRFPTFRWCKIQKNVYVNESFQRLGLINNINKRFLY